MWCLLMKSPQHSFCEATTADFGDSPVNARHVSGICTMLDERRRRWADVVQMLRECFVFAG